MSRYSEPLTSTIDRRPIDGAIQVHVEGDSIVIRATTQGVTHCIQCTEFNARRLLAALSITLGLPLKADAAKAIEMGAIA